MTNKMKYGIAAGVAAVVLFGAGFGIGTAAKPAVSLNESRKKAKAFNEGDDQDMDFGQGHHNGEFAQGSEQGDQVRLQDKGSYLQEIIDSLTDAQKKELAELLGVKTSDLENLDEEKIETLREAIKGLDSEKKEALFNLIPHEQGAGEKMEDARSGATSDQEASEWGMNFDRRMNCDRDPNCDKGMTFDKGMTSDKGMNTDKGAASDKKEQNAPAADTQSGATSQSRSKTDTSEKA